MIFILVSGYYYFSLHAMHSCQLHSGPRRVVECSDIPFNSNCSKKDAIKKKKVLKNALK